MIYGRNRFEESRTFIRGQLGEGCQMPPSEQGYEGEEAAGGMAWLDLAVGNTWLAWLSWRAWHPIVLCSLFCYASY